MKYVFVLLLIVLAGCHSQSEEKRIERLISQIPQKDKEKLEALFHHMMTGDYFACTLFGNKPITFQEFHEDPWKMSSYCMVCPYYHYFIDEGWKTWIKYQALFPSQKFIFTKIPSKAGFEFILLINKKALSNMFEENRDIVEQALGTRTTVDQVFYEFEEGKKAFSTVLNEHEGLVGLALGYGREGSLLVFRDVLLQAQIMKKNLHPLTPYYEHEKLASSTQNLIKSKEKIFSRKGIKWHQLTYFQIEDAEDPYDELNRLKNAKEIFCPSWEERIVDILSPNFFGFKGSAELAQLRNEYSKTMQRARNTFKKKSFLAGFLEQYCKSDV